VLAARKLRLAALGPHQERGRQDPHPRRMLDLFQHGKGFGIGGRRAARSEESFGAQTARFQTPKAKT